jgi:hypothetical protein
MVHLLPLAAVIVLGYFFLRLLMDITNIWTPDQMEQQNRKLKHDGR